MCGFGGFRLGRGFDLTPLNNGSSLSRVTAKSVTGIGILKLKGAQAPLEERFFCAYLMVDCTGASSDAPFPLSGNANSVQSATLLIGINGGGLILVWARHAYQVDARVFAATDLVNRRAGVRRQRIGHGLHADR